MSLELALVQPPNMYIVSQPATYQEAGQLLYSAGVIINELIDGQPPQATYAQALTAQTLKDLGRGWTEIFTIMAPEPSSPEPHQARFMWEPGGSLSIAFPQGVATEAVCSAMEDFYRAATWHEVMKEASPGAVLNELTGSFDVRFERNMDPNATQRMAEAVGNTATELFETLFRFEGGETPLMTGMTIRWESGIDCLDVIEDNHRAR